MISPGGWRRTSRASRMRARAPRSSTRPARSDGCTAVPGPSWSRPATCAVSDRRTCRDRRGRSRWAACPVTCAPSITMTSRALACARPSRLRRANPRRDVSRARAREHSRHRAPACGRRGRGHLPAHAGLLRLSHERARVRRVRTRGHASHGERAPCRGFPARRLCRSPARRRERAALRFHRGGGAARDGRSRRSGARRASWGRCAAHRAEGRHRRPAEAHARAARRRRLRGARRHGAARGPIRRIAAPSRVPPRVPRPRARGLRETSA